MSFCAVAVSTRMCAIPVGPATATTAELSTPALGQTGAGQLGERVVPDGADA